MSKERLKSPRVRLFVALDLPAEALAGLEAWGRKALADPALRPVPIESLHVTLAFLGYRPEKEVERIAETLEACRAPAPEMELLDPVARPERGRAQLFALPVRSTELGPLQSELQDRLVAEHLYEPEKRPFWPHVTVARVRPEGKGSKRPMPVSKFPQKLPIGLREQAFASVRLTLYLSELKPQGAKYTPLAQIELPRGRQ